MTTFSLFQLPLVAIEHVLCMMNPYELIVLSFVSSRTRRTVTNFFRITPKIWVLLGITNEPHIRIIKNEEWNFSWTSNEFRIDYERKTEFDRVVHKFNTYSKNPIEDLMKWYDYIRKVLGCRKNPSEQERLVLEHSESAMA